MTAWACLQTGKWFLSFILPEMPSENPTEATAPECNWHNHGTFPATVPLKLTSIFKGAQRPLLTWHKDSLCSTERLLSSTEASSSFQNKNTAGGKSSGMSGIPKCCSLSSPAYLYLSSRSRPDSLSQSQSPVGMHHHNSTITSHGHDVRLRRQQLPGRNKLWINFKSF